jgi:hypothetical protein
MKEAKVVDANIIPRHLLEMKGSQLFYLENFLYDRS